VLPSHDNEKTGGVKKTLMLTIDATIIDVLFIFIIILLAKKNKIPQLRKGFGIITTDHNILNLRIKTPHPPLGA
jgi:hypothetical protein